MLADQGIGQSELDKKTREKLLAEQAVDRRKLDAKGLGNQRNSEHKQLRSIKKPERSVEDRQS